MILQQIIQQFSDAFFYRYGFTEEISDVIYSGLYVQVAPKCWYYNGDTYFTAVTSEATRNPVLYRYRSSDDSIVGVDVGTIDNTDPLNHQNPAIAVVDDFIYVLMVNGHGQDIKIWKSDTTDISDGFTLFHTITDFDFGYLHTYRRNNYQYFLSRDTQSDFGSIVGKSADSSFVSWDVNRVTLAEKPTTGYRHYPYIPTPYNEDNWNYFSITLRNDNASSDPDQIFMYFGHAFYKTQDFVTYYSLDENFSKNVVSSGAITQSEVNSNLMYIGSESTDEDYTSHFQGCVINGVIYGSYVSQSINYHKFYKIENGVKTEYECNIPNLSINPFSFNVLTILSNGNNLVIRVSGGDVYVCDFNFNNQSIAYTVADNQIYPINAPIYPFNLDEVGEIYALGGQQVYTGAFPYIVTNDKFIR